MARGEDGTVMINAASIVGFRDEQINGAIVVKVGFGMYDFLNP